MLMVELPRFSLVSRPGLAAGRPRTGRSEDGVLWAESRVPYFLSVLRNHFATSCPVRPHLGQ